MKSVTIAGEIASVASVCRRIGIGVVEPVLLKAAHHSSILIPDHAIVARVQSMAPIPEAVERAVRELAITSHLANQGAPALAPIPVWAGPHVQGPSVVTFWPYAENRRMAEEGDEAIAAQSLAKVHRAMRHFPDRLPDHLENLDRCWHVLTAGKALPLTLDDRQLLEREFRRLRNAIEMADAERIPVHGDAHLSNLLVDADGRSALWLDFEDGCLGPREYDIANLPSKAWVMFGDIDLRLVTTYAHMKSVCVAIWCSVDPDRSSAIREAADYHLRLVRQRAAQGHG